MFRVRSVVTGLALAGGLVGLLGMSTGCGEFWVYISKERTGNISVQFINATDYRASFSYGAYDAWENEGEVQLQQLSVSPNTTSAVQTLTCRRNVAVGTQDFVDRVLETEADEGLAGFDPDRFDTTVHFSDAPTGSDAEFLPTVGTALGAEALIGNDYSCGDLLVFTFVEDPDEEGGFRIDLEVILDVDRSE